MLFSNYSIKTILTGLRDKKIEFNWKLNDRATTEYTRQMFSEELTIKGIYEQINKVPNHLWDLECLQLLAALMSDCYHPSASQMNSIVGSPEIIPS